MTELGISTDVRPLHLLKAELPILVTDSGISTDVRQLYPLKALALILSREIDMVTCLQLLLSDFPLYVHFSTPELQLRQVRQLNQPPFAYSSPAHMIPSPHVFILVHVFASFFYICISSYKNSVFLLCILWFLHKLYE